MKNSVSIALFFLLSGFFLTILLGTLEHSRKLLGAAAGCLIAVVVIIVFLTPVELPSWRLGLGDDDQKASSSTTLGGTAPTPTTGPAGLSTTVPGSTTSSTWGTTISLRSTTSTTIHFGSTTTAVPHTTLYRTVTTGVSGG